MAVILMVFIFVIGLETRGVFSSIRILSKSLANLVENIDISPNFQEKKWLYIASYGSNDVRIQIVTGCLAQNKGYRKII